MERKSYNHAINLLNFNDSSITSGFDIDTESIRDDQIIVKVDKVALTSNSISYVIGSQNGLLPWLDVFPAPEGYGHIPCWGFGDVIHSKKDGVAEGERLYGFFPVASHIIMQPGKTHERGFTDLTECRNGVTAFYNEYSYVTKEPGYAPQFEELMMLFRPLFGTSFLLESYCEDKDFFREAEQIIVTSASSKTSTGFGYLLKKNHSEEVDAIGITSTRNKAFVERLNCFNGLATYDNLDRIDPEKATVIFDMAGNRRIVESLHTLLGDSIVYSGLVGQTHWDEKDKSFNSTLAGPKPEYWSGPDQVMALRERHGERGFMKMVQASMIDFIMAASQWVDVSVSEGHEEIDLCVKKMLAGDIDASKGIVLKP